MANVMIKINQPIDGVYTLSFYKKYAKVKGRNTFEYLDDESSYNSGFGPQLEEVFSFSPTQEQKDRLNYFNKLNIKELYKINKNWYDICVYIESGYIPTTSNAVATFNLNESPYNTSRQYFLNELLSALKEIRKEAICKGIIYKGLSISTGSQTMSSLNNIISSLVVMDILPIDFKTEDGSFITFKTYDEVKELYTICNKNVQKCFTAEKQAGSDLSVLPDVNLYNMYIKLVKELDKSELLELFNKHMED